MRVVKPRIVLRADASKKTGYGHFIRSLALAGYLQDSFECCFASFNSDLKSLTRFQLTEILKACVPFAVSGNTLEEFDEDFLMRIHSTDIVVLDNYYFSTEYQQRIKDKGCKLVCIDDMHDRHMVCDMLITPSPLVREDFSLEDYTEFHGGVEWAFLRKPFLNPQPIRNIPSKIKSVVIAMGGADAFNLTDKIIRILHHEIPDAEINAICAESVSISDESRKIARIYTQLSAEKIVELFDSADIGVFPASTVAIEAFSRKLPVIAGYYVENQKAFYDFGIQRRYFSPLGWLLDEAESISRRLKGIILNHRPMPVVMDFIAQRRRVIELFNELKER